MAVYTRCIVFVFILFFYLFSWSFLLKCLSLAAGCVNSIFISLWILLQNPANLLYLMERFSLLVRDWIQPWPSLLYLISIGMYPLSLSADRLVTSSTFALWFWIMQRSFGSFRLVSMDACHPGDECHKFVFWALTSNRSLSRLLMCYFRRIF
jgi:hypothetical protein